MRLYNVKVIGSTGSLYHCFVYIDRFMTHHPDDIRMPREDPLIRSRCVGVKPENFVKDHAEVGVA